MQYLLKELEAEPGSPEYLEALKEVREAQRRLRSLLASEGWKDLSDFAERLRKEAGKGLRSVDNTVTIFRMQGRLDALEALMFTVNDFCSWSDIEEEIQMQEKVRAERAAHVAVSAEKRKRGK